MSFCQNHLNHHCIHAHNCTDASHRGCPIKNCKKHQKTDLMPTVPTRSQKNLKNTKQQHQQKLCHFNQKCEQSTAKLQCKKCQNLEQELKQANKNVNDGKKQIIQLSNKNDKISQQNRHLHGVIEYYREELDRIIKCSQKDVQNEIKRHIKQNTQLAARNKVLFAKLNELQNLVSSLQSLNEQYHTKLNSARNEKQQIIGEYNQLIDKFKKYKNQQSDKQSHTTEDRKRLGNVQQKYSIIIEELNRNVESLSNQNRKYHAENKDLQQKLQVLKVKMNNNQKLTKMEQQSVHQRQNVLKIKIRTNEEEIKRLQQLCNKLQKQLKVKQQQLSFSKKVIEKQLKFAKQNKELFEQIKGDGHHNSNNRQKQNNQHISLATHLHQINSNRNQKGYIDQLQRQIKVLQQKIILLESQSKKGHSIQNIQQYVLKIGASEAFKKIIQQKNQFIKKLIKQKQVLYHKIA